MRSSRLVLAIVTLVALLVTATGHDVSAESGFSVIVNGRNNARALDKKTLADAFLKKRTQWGDETTILPIDLGRASPVRKQFSEQVIGRSVSAVRTYWNRLVFSGRGVPPPEVASDDEVVRYVSKHAGAIGYVSASTNLKDSGVKIIEVR
jgi:ABC-type phosphate transport system substrate-binding protein